MVHVAHNTSPPCSEITGHSCPNGCADVIKSASPPFQSDYETCALQAAFDVERHCLLCLRLQNLCPDIVRAQCKASFFTTRDNNVCAEHILYAYVITILVPEY